MAVIFHLHHQNPHHSFFKFFTLSFPLFFLLISWASSTTTTTTSLPVSDALTSRGYSLFASTIISATTTNSFNATGTILAPPDFTFSFATAKFNHLHRAPPRPSTSLLLYHTLPQPLTWQDLNSCADGDELRTLVPNLCLFVSKKSNWDFSISGSKKSIVSIKIRQPNLYMDDHLIVHGIDGVLDPTSASTCAVPNPTVEIKSKINRSFLDHAIRALKRRGFSVVATATAIKRSDLMKLKAVTVFAPSDKSLFSFSDGFRYDFLHHVVPKRLRFAELARIPTGTVIDTMAPNKTVVVGSADGTVTINGVRLDGFEIYQNQWIVVVTVSRTLDDGNDSEAKSPISGEVSDSVEDGDPTPAPYISADSEMNSPSPTGLSDYGMNRVPSTAPSYSGESRVESPFVHAGVPAPISSYSVDSENSVGSSPPARKQDYIAEDIAGDSILSPSPSPSRSALADSHFSPVTSQFVQAGVSSPTRSHSVDSKNNDGSSAPASEHQYIQEDIAGDSISSPSPSPLGSALTGSHCAPAVPVGIFSDLSIGVEGGDLFCPVIIDVAQSSPSGAYSKFSKKYIDLCR